MKEIVRQILIYIIITGVLSTLISNNKYKQYFQFFTGLVMIMIIVTPVVGFLKGENNITGLVEEKLLNIDLSDAKAQINYASGSLKNVLKKQYKKEIGKKVKSIGTKYGKRIDKVSVDIKSEKVKKNKEMDYKIEQIVCYTNNSDENKSVSISNKNEVCAVNAVAEKNENRKKNMENEKIRKEICSCFQMKENQVKMAG